jgi:hypothetical protein
LSFLREGNVGNAIDIYILLLIYDFLNGVENILLSPSFYVGKDNKYRYEDSEDNFPFDHEEDP